MIIKLWPIKASYGGAKGKVGGHEGVKNALDYVTDEEKTIRREGEDEDHIRQVEGLELDMADMEAESFINSEVDFDRVIGYMSNKDKIGGRYISGYLCSPENAVAQFEHVRNLYAEKGKKSGNLAYHMVQSFPENLDIDDEEVHQCGLELCEKLGLYQAVVCSHVHPALNERGEVTGVCKHNHILFNAYPDPSKVSWEEKPKKYHDCKETYRQLRVWNDEIAIEHGLPIIRNPDEMRVYSWKESKEKNRGTSWKERIRMDIDAARKATLNWDDFVAYMQGNGYSLKIGKQVTYLAPDGTHKSRDKTLGREFTRESLEQYWKMREEIFSVIQDAEDMLPSPALLELAKEAREELKVAIPLGQQGMEHRSYYYLPLSKGGLNRDALNTYFDGTERYDICDENGQPVASFSGAELTSYYMDMDSDEQRNRRAAKTQEELEEEEEAERRRRAEEAKKDKDYYWNPRFLNLRTNRPYRIPRYYDSSGRPMTDLEVIFVLAVVILRQEGALWLPKTIPPEFIKDVCYATPDWKAQNMLDAIRTARDEGIRRPMDIDKRLEEVGAAYSRARASVKRNTRVKEKMMELRDAVVEYERTGPVVKELREMPAGPEKEALLQSKAEILERYKKARAFMFAHGINSKRELDDFKQRWREVNQKLTDATKLHDTTKEEYRKLKKLKYNVELAQTERYCYGPEYGKQKEQKQEKKRPARSKTVGYISKEDGNVRGS